MFIDRKQSIALRQTGAVVDFADSGLGTALLQAQSRSTGMGNDVTANGLFRVWVEHGTWSAVHLCHNLIRDDHCNSELICESLERS